MTNRRHLPPSVIRRKGDDYALVRDEPGSLEGDDEHYYRALNSGDAMTIEEAWPEGWENL